VHNRSNPYDRAVTFTQVIDVINRAMSTHRKDHSAQHKLITKYASAISRLQQFEMTTLKRRRERSKRGKNKMHEEKMRHKTAGVENAGKENARKRLEQKSRILVMRAGMKT